MECWLFEILMSCCDERQKLFFFKHKKDIKFKSIDGLMRFDINNVPLLFEKTNLSRVANIKPPAGI